MYIFKLYNPEVEKLSFLSAQKWRHIFPPKPIKNHRDAVKLTCQPKDEVLLVFGWPTTLVDTAMTSKTKPAAFSRIRSLLVWTCWNLTTFAGPNTLKTVARKEKELCVHWIKSLVPSHGIISFLLSIYIQRFQLLWLLGRTYDYLSFSRTLMPALNLIAILMFFVSLKTLSDFWVTHWHCKIIVSQSSIRGLAVDSIWEKSSFKLSLGESYLLHTSLSKLSWCVVIKSTIKRNNGYICRVKVKIIAQNVMDMNNTCKWNSHSNWSGQWTSVYTVYRFHSCIFSAEITNLISIEN